MLNPANATVNEVLMSTPHRYCLGREDTDNLENNGKVVFTTTCIYSFIMVQHMFKDRLQCRTSVTYKQTERLPRSNQVNQEAPKSA